MTDYLVQSVDDDTAEAAYRLIGKSLHIPVTDELWATWQRYFCDLRKYAVLDHRGNPVGVLGTFATEVAIPGGKKLPGSAGSGAGVRPDRTRAGVFTAIMDNYLRDCFDQGYALSVMHPSEAAIYGRFGYGVATRAKDVRIDAGHVSLRADLPVDGRVRMLDIEEAKVTVPRIYEDLALYRPGMVQRPHEWWRAGQDSWIRNRLAVVHVAADGREDGFTVYGPTDETAAAPQSGVTLQVNDLHATDVSVATDLWRFLLSVDLVATIHALARPIDEPIELMLQDPRACQALEVQDHTWVRLVDVKAALSARSYMDARPVVIEVTDRLLPRNEGRYRITPEGCEPTTSEPDLGLDVEALTMIYFGEWKPSTLAALGRISVISPNALGEADGLFRVDTRPWCGTTF